MPACLVFHATYRWHFATPLLVHGVGLVAGFFFNLSIVCLGAAMSCFLRRCPRLRR